MMAAWLVSALLIAEISAGDDRVAAAFPFAKQQFLLEVPRVTAEELAKNASLSSGHYPYIVVGAMDDWPAMNKWKDLDHVQTRVADEWVDYYPENMYNLGNKPYLHKFETAKGLFNAPKRRPRYLQLRLGHQGWQNLMQDMKELPNSMWTEKDWIKDCMPKTADIDNFYRVNQWNMLLIGETGTGIFFHHDHLAASSWQAHVVGRKRWVMCPYDDTDLFSTDIFTFEPDYDRHPQFAQATCASVVVEPGEILYYPAYWWHQTQCLDRPTIGVTGLMVGVEDNRRDVDFKVHEQFYKDIRKKCANPGEDISIKWPGAAPPISEGVCKSMKKCFKLWDKNFDAIDFRYDIDQPYVDHTSKAIAFEEAGNLTAAVRSFRAAARCSPIVFGYTLLSIPHHCRHLPSFSPMS
jgi:hypothetical protein